MSLDPARAHALMERLSFPRRSNGAGARAAREIITDCLRAAGVTPVSEPFTFSPHLANLALPGALLFTAGVVLASAFLATRSPVGALWLYLIGLLPLILSTRWAYSLERILDLGTPWHSANVVGHIPAAGVAQRHLILMAHYDSKSQRLPIAARMILALAVLIGGLLLLLGLVAGVALPGGGNPWLVRGAGIAAATGLLVLALNPSEDHSMGSLDNAAGVGLLLELARVLAERPPQRTRVTLVATGGEEEGLAGAVRFFQAHPEEWQADTFLINLDSPGGPGPLAVLSAFGIPPRNSGQGLAARAMAAAGTEGVSARSAYIPAGAGTDHFAATLRGIPAITLSSMGPGLRRIHSTEDMPALVTRESLGSAGRVALRLIRDLDQNPG